MRGALPDDVTQIPDGQTRRWTNLTLGAGPASIIRWTTGYSETDSLGTPELATVEKGLLACEHAVEQLGALVCWCGIDPWSRGAAISPRRRRPRCRSRSGCGVRRSHGDKNAASALETSNSSPASRQWVLTSRPPRKTSM